MFCSRLSNFRGPNWPKWALIGQNMSFQLVGPPLKRTNWCGGPAAFLPFCVRLRQAYHMVGLALLLGPPTAPAAPMVGLALAKNYGAFFRFLVVYLLDMKSRI